MTAQLSSTEPVRSITGTIFNWAGQVYDVLCKTGHAAQCAREAERLLALSDQELAKRGLQRDEVIRHAFASYLAV